MLLRTCILLVVLTGGALSCVTRSWGGPRCTGCPQHFCDDDPAIVEGYCCGCAGLFDRLPVSCNRVGCPLNTYDLCRDYEYMMHCCC